MAGVENSKKIRLGICMAGAVSAGAYTAGVIDYLIETLERWEQRKTEIKRKKELGQQLSTEDKLVPMHDVVIEVLSGSSAGGMTAAVLSYSLNDNSYLTRRNSKMIEDNYDVPDDTDSPTKLYNAWINMVDEDKTTTFEKLMNADDVVSIGKMKSLLNSKPIDDIAGNSIPVSINFQPPAYISEKLSVVLSVTNLEGIPVDVRFTNVADDNPTRNVLITHSGFLHYQFTEDDKIDFDYPPVLISDSNKERLALAAKATGAFPFGLANRWGEVYREHFVKLKERLKANNLHVNLPLKEKENYFFTAVDGGAINNEPISTTFTLLNQKKEAYHPTDENYVILIDPFPSITNASNDADDLKTVDQSEEGYIFKDQLFKLIGAFRNESSFKQENLRVSDQDKERYLISPAKKGYYFLACGLIEGFGGFMKKAFRKHDYQLGRKNCQSFLRYYFGVEMESFSFKSGVTLTAEQETQWKYDDNYGKQGLPVNYKIPLIPDMLQLDKPETNEYKDLNDETRTQLFKVRTEIAEPVYDGLTSDELNIITASIKARIKKITHESYKSLGKNVAVSSWWLGVGLKLLSPVIKKKILNAAAGKVNEYLGKTFSPQSVKQDELVNKFAGIIEGGGKFFKFANVIAVLAKGGEKVVSFKEKTEVKTVITAVKAEGGEILDKQVTAVAGDFIVTDKKSNPSKYLVKAAKFNECYVHVGGDTYKAKEGLDLGKEDWNIAAAGEYIVTNGTSRREKYIVKAKNFNEKYDHVADDIYRPNDKALVYALQVSAASIRKYDQLHIFRSLITKPMNPIYIEPKWKQSQSLYLNDYLVAPLNKDEVYCIKKKDFEETYKRLTE